MTQPLENILVQKATQLFGNGYNCAQAVLCAYHEEVNVPSETLKALAWGFGGGMRQGNTCGVITGALMVLGLMNQKIGGSVDEQKNRSAALTVSYLQAFKEKQGHLNCKDLLGYDVLNPQEVANNREKKRVTCSQLVKSSIMLIEECLAPYLDRSNGVRG